MGSSSVVKLRQDETFFGIAVRMGGFFFGCVERDPDVFRGKMGAGARLEPRFLVVRHRRISGKIRVDTS